MKYAVAALILAIPLYPKFPFMRVPGSQVYIRLEDFLIFGIVAFWIWGNVGKLFKKPLRTFTFSFGLFWAVGLVSLLSAILVTHSVAPLIGLLHFVRRIQYMIVFFIGATSVKSSKDIGFYIKCMLAVTVYTFVFGVGQKHFAWPIITTQNAEYAKGIALQYMPWGHVVSTFAGHYDLATYIVLVSPVFILLLVAKKSILESLFEGVDAKKMRIVLLVALALNYWLLINAASRIAFAAYLGVGSLALIFTKRFRMLVAFIVVSIVVTFTTSSNLVDRYMNIFNVTVNNTLSAVTEFVVHTAHAQEVQEDRSTNIRLNVEWPRAIRALEKNPFLGTGYSSITLATDNGFLRILGEVGLLGFLAFGIIILTLVSALIRAIAFEKAHVVRRLFAAAMLAALPGILLNMVFLDILEASKFAIMFWLLMGCAVARYEA